MKNLGMEMVFWKVAMRPGQPLAFGTIAGKPVFGLPGNPVSSMISFEQFVRPSLLKMMGSRQLFRPVIEAILKEEIKKIVGRRYFIRGSVSFEKGEYFVTTTGEQGSGILRSMVKANGLIVVSEEQERVRAGEKVKVQMLDRNF
jgi:molybdopterin molybdotransferase